MSTHQPLAQLQHRAILLDTALANAVLGHAYTTTITLTPDSASCVFSISSGNLPHGLQLDPFGTISGAPTELGLFIFSVVVTDENGYFDARDYSMHVFSSEAEAANCPQCPPQKPSPKFLWLSLLIFVTLGVSIIDLLTLKGRLTMKLLLALLLVAAFLILPTHIAATRPELLTPLAQLLFNLLLFAASSWLAVLISAQDAARKAAATWLPAAETACNQLLTISFTAERMRSKHAKSCDCLSPLFSGIESEKIAPIKQLVQMQCQDISENLATLRSNVDNGFSTWEIFINENCKQGQCVTIFQRLNAHCSQLAAQLATDYPRAGCSTPQISPITSALPTSPR